MLTIQLSVVMKGVEMTNRELAKQTLDRRMEEFEKYQKFKNKEDLDNATRTLVAQVQMVREVNLINTIMTNEYLSRIEKKYRDTLHSEQFKEYREQVINFNDDFITSRERLYNMREQEKKNTQSMRMWEREVDKKSTANPNSGTNVRSEISKNKDNERENESEKEIV